MISLSKLGRDFVRKTGEINLKSHNVSKIFYSRSHIEMCDPSVTFKIFNEQTDADQEKKYALLYIAVSDKQELSSLFAQSL